MQTDTKKIRLDKWLWAARFFKTRSLATDAINGGKVHVDNQRCKPAKEVHIGQVISLRIGYVERTVVVKDLSDKRGPASAAVLLYEETPESITAREQQAEQRKANMEYAQRDHGVGRPTKKQRRLISRFVQKS